MEKEKLNTDVDEKQIKMFLKRHIPDNTDEYAPEGTDEIHCGSVLAEHFKALSNEETLLLSKIANIRFV